MIQAFAAGYFLWDLQICLRYMRIFGVGLLMHAVAALVVFSLGFVSIFLSIIILRSGLNTCVVRNRDPSSTSTAPPSSSTSSPPPS